MKILTVNITLHDLNLIEAITGEGKIYPSRSELIRVAVREFLIMELNRSKTEKIIPENYPFHIIQKEGRIQKEI